MQLVSKFDKGFRFLLRVVDIFSKYAWVIPLKVKKGSTITNAFQKILGKSNGKPNKIWVDKGSKFYNRPMKSWLEKNAIEMYSTHNEGKSLVAERFMRILKKNDFNINMTLMTSISKNKYKDKLDDIVNKYNNTYSTIKMKAVDVKSNTCINYSKEINEKYPKFKIGDIVRMSK